MEYVIADADSLHNATLRAYYIAQVACGLKSKQNFFISKSGVRTGKGLRHIGLSGIFNKIDIELDLLTKGGFEANNAWGVFAGGEMALATEQGDIVGDKMERVLKIIATEKTHIARSIGGNLGMVNLTSVLCIDTNRTVALSDEMNGRAVLIQYRNRPEEETDLEREKNFEEYWQAFTEMDKSPKIEGVIGFLLVSLEYFQRNGMKFDWRTVEVVNDDDLDDFQIYLINRLSETNFVERDFYVKELYKSTYGTNNNQACQKMRTIGVKSYRKQTTGGRKIPGYKVDNIKRFNKFSGEQKENSNLFDIFERTNPL
ncbi:bacteriophage resistance protein [Streptococcus pyogenes]|nr:bacteriophage resistance protein [Streptococcus pyogenes]VHG76367.1 bacteriophage resistance protein [Streptococcus pyogenes]VHH87751.1 bacteriophage resistance protein [Streptococcus pyogenes]VHJ63156.1 bacteriophage resistance protein [Streptococcus pyogenes]VHM46628.1 bacteriophage resistance protein [Streptococcus pyogenes]